MNSKLFDERGQALILIALAAVGIFGIVGLAIDGGVKFSDQRQAQNAADTAALAAAYAKVNTLIAADTDSSITTSPAQCNSSSMVGASDVCTALVLAGLDRAGSNGYDNFTNNTVKIYSPPLTGPNAGNGNFVQVVITSTLKTTFSRIIGIQQTKNTVLAEGSIRHGGALANGAMLISYDPDPNCSVSGTGGYSVQLNGSATINLSGGGIFLNSDETCGFKIPNCADLNITGGTISSAGNNIDLASCTFDPAFTPQPYQDPVAIPDDVFWPDVPPECSMSGFPTPYKFSTQIYGPDNKWHDQWLIYPGYYTVFPPKELVSIEGEVPKRSYIYMASGTYCIDPGGPGNTTDLSWSPVDAAFLNGSTDLAKNPYANYNPDGVTLYIKKGGGFTINTLSPTYLDASTTGDLQGYLIILEGNHTTHPSCTINGGADINLKGMIFAPYCNFTVNGKAGETAEINAQLLGWDLKVNGNNQINFDFDPSNQVIIKSQIGLMR